LTGLGCAAARAARLGATAWAYVSLDRAGGLYQPHGGINEALKVVAGIEQSGEQHWPGVHP